jgi:predicted permease
MSFDSAQGRRLYALLLLLYPSSFRAEYGAELHAIFARRRRDARSFGARLGLWAEAVSDVLGNATRLHWEMLRQDVSYTLRSLRRTPAFTITVVLVSALGIGATTAAFSVADHVLLRPLPFAEPDRLVKLWQNQQYRGYPRMDVSPPNYLDWKRASTSYERMAAYTSVSQNLSGDVEPMRLDGTSATSDLFLTLGARAAVGRVFVPTDDEAAANVVLFSDRLWRQQFGADPNVLGRRVLLDDVPHLIIGVMPPGFFFPTREVQFWTPRRFRGPSDEDRTNYHLQVVAKLAPGVTIEQARAEAQVIGADLERAYPQENAKSGITINRLRDEVGWRTRMLLMALVGASVCVLLIACTNLASLLLARALARQRELAVRAAIGAGRERLLRQMLTEGLVLAILGGVLGVLLAVVAGPLFARLVPTSLPIAEIPGPDPRMLALAGLLTLLTGLGFGALPALRASRQVDGQGLRESGRVGAGRRTERLRSGLIVAQVSASIVLLISAGLLIRALWQVQQRDPGFRTDGVLTLRTSLPMPKYAPTQVRGDFYRRVLTEISALPGVSSAAYISALPMVWRGGIWRVTLDGRPEDPADTRVASVRFITPGLFDSLSVPLVRGRNVSEGDTRDRPFVAVISESFAKDYWPGQDPLGRKFQVAFSERTVVGIVGDVRVRGLEQVSEPQVYLPYQQVGDGWLSPYAPKDLVVRSSQPAVALIPSIRDIIHRADPQQPISEVRALADVVDNETTPRLVQVRVLGGFAAIAVLLAGVGIHGLLAFAVSNRLREIGVRLALGASGQDVLRMILRQGLVLAMGGALVGVGLAYAAGRALQALLAGVSPADMMTFALAVGFVFTMALLGSIPPAIRASRVDPTTAMRAE